MSVRGTAIVSVKLVGAEQLAAGLSKALRDVFAAGSEGLYEMAKEIEVESKAEVPSLTGTLRNSSYVEQLGITEDSATVRIGYGGPNDRINPRTGQPASSYALPVHEKLNAHHSNGKAKFLEDPVRRHEGDIESKLAAYIAAALGG